MKKNIHRKDAEDAKKNNNKMALRAKKIFMRGALIPFFANFASLR